MYRLSYLIKLEWTGNVFNRKYSIIVQASEYELKSNKLIFNVTAALLLKIPFSVTKRLNITQIRYDRLSIIDGILQYHYCTLQ